MSSLSAINKDVKKELTNKFKNCRVSVSTSVRAGGRIYDTLVILFSAPFEVFNNKDDYDAYGARYIHYSDLKNNQKLTKDGKEFFIYAVDLLLSRMGEGGSPHFNIDLHVGGRNSPFQVINKSPSMPLQSGSYQSKRKIRTLESNIIEGIFKSHFGG